MCVVAPAAQQGVVFYKMIDAEQIRAARALLDWPTSELAKRSGLTVNGINKIERGHVVAQRDSLKKIQKVFEEAGIEFLPGSGIRRKDKMVTTIEGKHHRKALIESMYNTLKHTGGEFLVIHEREGALPENLGLKELKESLTKRRKANIHHRLLVLEDDPGLFAPFDTYHIIDKKYFAACPLRIWDSKVSFSIDQHPSRGIIIEDSRIAEAARRLYNFVWDHTKPVPKEIQDGPVAKKLFETVWGRSQQESDKVTPKQWPESKKSRRKKRHD